MSEIKWFRCGVEDCLFTVDAQYETMIRLHARWHRENSSAPRALGPGEKACSYPRCEFVITETYRVASVLHEQTHLQRKAIQFDCECGFSIRVSEDTGPVVLSARETESIELLMNFHKRSHGEPMNVHNLSAIRDLVERSQSIALRDLQGSPRDGRRS